MRDYYERLWPGGCIGAAVSWSPTRARRSLRNSASALTLRRRRPHGASAVAFNTSKSAGRFERGVPGRGVSDEEGEDGLVDGKMGSKSIRPSSHSAMLGHASSISTPYISPSSSTLSTRSRHICPPSPTTALTRSSDELGPGEAAKATRTPCGVRRREVCIAGGARSWESNAEMEERTSILSSVWR